MESTAHNQNEHMLEDDARTTADAVASILSRSTTHQSDGTSIKVFSYGSNSTKQLCQRLGRSEDAPYGQLPFEAVPASLPGYSRIFAGLSKRWGGAVASCHPNPSSSVLGLMVTMTEKELEVLDTYEIGYDRQQCRVLANGSSFEAYVYLKKDLEFTSLPSESYLQAITKMFEEAGHSLHEFEICKVDVSSGAVKVVKVQNLEA